MCNMTQTLLVLTLIMPFFNSFTFYRRPVLRFTWKTPTHKTLFGSHAAVSNRYEHEMVEWRAQSCAHNHNKRSHTLRARSSPRLQNILLLVRRASVVRAPWQRAAKFYCTTRTNIGQVFSNCAAKAFLHHENQYCKVHF